MNQGETTPGDKVFFAMEGVDPLISIQRGEVANVIYPDTTNEILQIKQVDVETSEVSHLMLRHAECCSTRAEALNSARAKLYEELDVIRSKLMCLGDHTLARSRWGRQ